MQRAELKVAKKATRRESQVAKWENEKIGKWKNVQRCIWYLNELTNMKSLKVFVHLLYCCVNVFYWNIVPDTGHCSAASSHTLDRTLKGGREKKNTWHCYAQHVQEIVEMANSFPTATATRTANKEKLQMSHWLTPTDLARTQVWLWLCSSSNKLENYCFCFRYTWVCCLSQNFY